MNTFKQFTWAKPKSWTKVFQFIYYTYALKSSSIYRDKTAPDPGLRGAEGILSDPAL